MCRVYRVCRVYNYSVFRVYRVYRLFFRSWGLGLRVVPPHEQAQLLPPRI